MLAHILGTNVKVSEYKRRKVSTCEGKCVLVEVGALISWCIYSYRIVMLLVPYMWASTRRFN